jgi:hypothetical protein
MTMPDRDLDYEAIRRNVEKGVQDQRQFYRRLFFGINLTIYLVTMLIVWGVAVFNAQTGSGLYDGRLAEAAIVLLPTVMWGFVILCHAALLYTESATAEKTMREQVLARELGEEILRTATSYDDREKPKRDNATSLSEQIALTDDGELVYAEESGIDGQVGAYRRA